MFTESKIIKQITILPESGAINVQWANQVLKDGEVISETFERKAYSANMDGFNTEVGALDVNAFLAAFNTAALDEKLEALAAKDAAEAALTTAMADHAAAIVAKDATIADLEQRLAAVTPVEEPVITPPVPGVPQSVTMRQARLALAAAGLLATVNDVVAGAGEATQIEWEFAATVDRSWPTLIALQGALGLADTQIDDLFTLAATL